MTQSLLHGALAALAAHKDLIEEAYARGGIRRTVDNAREVMTLHQYRILVSDGQDEYHLSRTFSRFLDDVTQRQRLYEALGENIGALDDRIYNLKSEFATAVREGRVEEMDVIAAQFSDACADLSDAISTSLSRLLVQAESRFGVVTSVAAKLRQNEHYLKQAERLSGAVSALSRIQNVRWEAHEGDPLYADLVGPYHRLVASRLGEWNAEILRVTSILKTFLFRLRQVAPDVSRLRAFADFLHHHPGYEPPDFTERRTLPPWALRDPGVRLAAHPDVQDESMGPELQAIASKLPAPKVVVRRQREAGALTKSGGQARKKLVVPPEKEALRRFVLTAVAAGAPLSARDWLRADGAELAIEEDIWLHLVLQARESRAAPFDKAVFRSVEYRGRAAISRNVFVRDVLVHGR